MRNGALGASLELTNELIGVVYVCVCACLDSDYLISLVCMHSLTFSKNGYYLSLADAW